MSSKKVTHALIVLTREPSPSLFGVVLLDLPVKTDLHVRHKVWKEDEVPENIPRNTFLGLNDLRELDALYVATIVEPGPV